MDRHPRTLLIAFVIGVALAVLRVTVIGDARWWNLVMAGLLLAILGLYLLRERHRPR